MIVSVKSSVEPTADTLLEERPDPLPAVRGRGFLLERLLTVNTVVSLALLSWSALVLRRPALARTAWRSVRRKFPRLVGGSR
jgi:hypothetical protein